MTDNYNDWLHHQLSSIHHRRLDSIIRESTSLFVSDCAVQCTFKISVCLLGKQLPEYFEVISHFQTSVTITKHHQIIHYLEQHDSRNCIPSIVDQTGHENSPLLQYTNYHSNKACVSIILCAETCL